MRIARSAAASRIPDQLAAKLPPVVLHFYERRKFWTSFGVGVNMLAVFGQVPAPARYSWYRYLIVPLLGPALGFVWHVTVPFDLTRYVGNDRMIEQLQPRSTANTIIQGDRSRGALGFLLRVALRLAVIQFSAGILPVLMHWHELNWFLSLAYLAELVACCSIGSTVALGSELVTWTVHEWLKDLAEGNN
jgi:hypothetical protein